MRHPSVLSSTRTLCVATHERSCPPQGILVVAAAAPSEWDIRFIDENISPAMDSDFAWAEVVLVSGMHIQRAAINDINQRAQRMGCTTVLGGPSVSGCPEYYPNLVSRLGVRLPRPTYQVTQSRRPRISWHRRAFRGRLRRCGLWPRGYRGIHRDQLPVLNRGAAHLRAAAAAAPCTPRHGRSGLPQLQGRPAAPQSCLSAAKGGREFDRSPEQLTRADAGS